jgi:hypothetical protein
MKGKKRGCTFMLKMGFKPKIPLFEEPKGVYSLTPHGKYKQILLTLKRTTSLPYIQVAIGTFEH